MTNYIRIRLPEILGKSDRWLWNEKCKPGKYVGEGWGEDEGDAGDVWKCDLDEYKSCHKHEITILKNIEQGDKILVVMPGTFICGVGTAMKWGRCEDDPELANVTTHNPWTGKVLEEGVWLYNRIWIDEWRPLFERRIKTDELVRLVGDKGIVNKVYGIQAVGTLQKWVYDAVIGALER